ncbi:unnamed protein product [Ectocarpus sp. 12 AP-2014]
MSTFPERASLEGLEIEIFRLVSKGATPEQWAEWLRVPLEHAAAQGSLALVDKLLGAGADGSAGYKGCAGRTLLQAAAVGGSKGVVSSLLRAGAQPDVNEFVDDLNVLHEGHQPFFNFHSPLYQATLNGHKATARLLILAGANVNFVDLLDGHSVLHQAIEGCHERLAKELIMSGADVRAHDSHDLTPLHLAALKGLDAIVSALVLRGVDKDAVDKDGRSALILACSSCVGDKASSTVVETLLAAGADVSIRDNFRSSALDSASLCGHVPTIHVLVRHGVGVNSCDDRGDTALHKAALQDQAGSVDALIEAGAGMEIKRRGGATPVWIASFFCCPKTLLALFLKGAITNAPDNTGKTPLHVACLSRGGDLAAVVDLLLRWGADETAVDNEGRTPAERLNDVPGDRSCSQEDFDRAQLLLARAPADRAWRRRGWLVMLRARASTARIANCDSSGDTRVESSGAAASVIGEGRKVARREGAASVARGGREQAGSGVDDVEPDSPAGRRAVRGAVGWLVGMQPEGVFRSVLSFL